MESQIPLGRIGTVDDAAAALLLLSDDASSVAGAQFCVGGGIEQV